MTSVDAFASDMTWNVTAFTVSGLPATADTPIKAPATTAMSIFIWVFLYLLVSR
jgi:hypothetical protein